ncbi:hypothetical protein [Pelagibacterium limicola]|uniref:hypothetical protein n=1 Tax=Pelagibacterium limicola TaxID=2791022 RepID=UPI0018AF85FF|nr:hypothetical protein [Pelagibacterium limicola]
MVKFSEKSLEVAQSQMSREALSHWDAFHLPSPSKKIETLLAALGEDENQESASDQADDSHESKHWE